MGINKLFKEMDEQINTTQLCWTSNILNSELKDIDKLELIDKYNFWNIYITVPDLFSNTPLYTEFYNTCSKKYNCFTITTFLDFHDFSNTDVVSLVDIIWSIYSVLSNNTPIRILTCTGYDKDYIPQQEHLHIPIDELIKIIVKYCFENKITKFYKLKTITLLDKLKEKKLITDYTQDINKLLNNNKVNVYITIYPMADSLELKHLYLIAVIKLFQDYGHNIIILIGKIENGILSENIIEYNMDKLIIQINSLLNNITIIKYWDWLYHDEFYDFINTICIFLNINDLSSSTFNFEYNTLLLNEYRDLYLNFNKRLGIDCYNIIKDIEYKTGLINHKIESEYTLWFNININSVENNESDIISGEIWLDKNKTSTDELYKYILNMDDINIYNLFYYFTDMRPSNIHTDIKYYKKLLTYLIIKKVNGGFEADKFILNSYIYNK